jgi:DNA-binding beta-propeller fold protein YncE
VRKLAWDAAAGNLVVGYNLYRADLSQASISFARQNATEPLAATVYSDELTTPGAFRYRLTSVNSAGIESDPGNDVDSPAVAFDVAFTFGKGVLDTPAAIAIDASRDRLVVSDTALHQLHVYDLAGTHKLQLEHYPGGHALDARGLAYNADGTRLYVADGASKGCRILDQDWNLTGKFGTAGKNPGEFESPSAAVVLGDRVLVADASNSTLQVFTPLGVYLSTAATQGTADGLLDAPSVMLLGTGGTVFVSDTNNNRIQTFKAADASFDKVLDYPPADGGPLLAPDGLAQDFRGWLYVSDTGNHRVVVFDSSGKFLFHFGADGALTVEFSTASGPRGMALDQTTGYLYVCDPGNHRIAVFKT